MTEELVYRSGRSALSPSLNIWAAAVTEHEMVDLRQGDHLVVIPREAIPAVIEALTRLGLPDG